MLSENCFSFLNLRYFTSSSFIRFSKPTVIGTQLFPMSLSHQSEAVLCDFTSGPGTDIFQSELSSMAVQSVRLTVFPVNSFLFCHILRITAKKKKIQGNFFNGKKFIEFSIC